MEIIDFTKFCLMSGKKSDLNSKMEVELNGKLYKIAISDEFAEDASIKAIRSKINIILDEIKTLTDRANDLGMTVTFQSQSKAKPQPIQQVAPQPVVAPVKNEQQEIAESTDIKPSVTNKELTTIDKKDTDGVVVPVEIPKKIVDNRGTTTIDIIKTSNQDVTRTVEEYNRGNHSYQNGYTQAAQSKKCMPCRGVGKIRMKSASGFNEITCSKCKGVGII